MKLFTRIILITGILILSIQYADSQSQKGWRGPGRTGIYNESSLLKSWPEKGPSLMWESNEAGTGYSSATVTDDAVYITGRKGDNDVLTAFNPDGSKKWEVAYGKASETGSYPDSRSTPTYFDKNIFVVSGHGDMVCVGTDGKIKWSVNYFQKYNSPDPRFGISESPLVTGNKVIGTPGGNKAAMVAFNIANGNVVWETPALNEGTQYVNPLLIEKDGKSIIVTHTAKQIIGVNPNDGKLEWKFDYDAVNPEKDGRNHINTPIYRDGFLFAGNGYGQTGAKIKINWDGSNPTLVWTNPEINPHVGGMVLIGNYIYSSTHDTNSKGRWICVDWTTGKTMWTTSWYNKGAIISADGMLYIYEEKTGHVGLVKPSSEKLDVVSKFQVTKGSGPYWSHPVIDKGRLFVRHGEYLGVYSIKAK